MKLLQKTMVSMVIMLAGLFVGVEAKTLFLAVYSSTGTLLQSGYTTGNQSLSDMSRFIRDAYKNGQKIYLTNPYGMKMKIVEVDQYWAHKKLIELIGVHPDAVITVEDKEHKHNKEQVTFQIEVVPVKTAVAKKHQHHKHADDSKKAEKESMQYSAAK